MKNPKKTMIMGATPHTKSIISPPEITTNKTIASNPAKSMILEFLNANNKWRLFIYVSHHLFL